MIGLLHIKQKHYLSIVLMLDASEETLTLNRRTVKYRPLALTYYYFDEVENLRALYPEAKKKEPSEGLSFLGAGGSKSFTPT